MHTDISDFDECSLLPLSTPRPSLVNPTCHHQPMSSDTNWDLNSHNRTSSSTAGLSANPHIHLFAFQFVYPASNVPLLAARLPGLPDRTLWRSRKDRLPVQAPGCTCLMSAPRTSVCWHCQEAKDVSGSFVFHLSTTGPIHFPEHFWSRQIHWCDIV